MIKLCPYCKSKKVTLFRDTSMCCTECFRVFGKSQLIDATVFDQITASLEVLAEKLVYYDKDAESRYIFYSDSSESCRLITEGWTSNILEVYYDTKPEAIAATVAKLKEVAE